MSGLNEIIQWTEDNIDFERGENPQNAFEFIDAEFRKDNRLPLADILGDQLPDYLKFLEESTDTSREDIKFTRLEERIESLQAEIGEFFNMLGTPIR